LPALGLVGSIMEMHRTKKNRCLLGDNVNWRLWCRAPQAEEAGALRVASLKPFRETIINFADEEENLLRKIVRKCVEEASLEMLLSGKFLLNDSDDWEGIHVG
jgi:hypothetical protein